MYAHRAHLRKGALRPRYYHCMFTYTCICDAYNSSASVHRGCFKETENCEHKVVLLCVCFVIVVVYYESCSFNLLSLAREGAYVSFRPLKLHYVSPAKS